ncbi:hypothetical protein CVM50_08085 [Pseudooceanicola marinus]|nr:hypothetical protein CVM50_08085 [Pseudooceanicola marinus]
MQVSCPLEAGWSCQSTGAVPVRGLCCAIHKAFGQILCANQYGNRYFLQRLEIRCLTDHFNRFVETSPPGFLPARQSDIAWGRNDQAGERPRSEIGIAMCELGAAGEAEEQGPVSGCVDHLAKGEKGSVHVGELMVTASNQELVAIRGYSVVRCIRKQWGQKVEIELIRERGKSLNAALHVTIAAMDGE